MASKLTLQFPATQKLIEIDGRRELVAGASVTCDICLPRYFQGRVKLISRQHFKIRPVGNEGFVIVDLGSLNGTSVNGDLLAPNQPRFLRMGDVIKIANQADFIIEVTTGEGWVTEALTIPVRTPKVSDTATGIAFDREHDRFIVDGRVVPDDHLTRLEYHLLAYFISHAGRTCSFDALAEHVWKEKEEKILNNTIAKAVSKLKQKLDAVAPDAGAYIRTRRGFGFKYEPGKEGPD